MCWLGILPVIALVRDPRPRRPELGVRTVAPTGAEPRVPAAHEGVRRVPRRRAADALRRGVVPGRLLAPLHGGPVPGVRGLPLALRPDPRVVGRPAGDVGEDP